MSDYPHPSSAAALIVSRLLQPATVAGLAATALTLFPRLAAAIDSVPDAAAVTGTHIRGTADSHSRFRSTTGKSSRLREPVPCNNSSR